jgi:hypothetical protein
MVNKLSYPAMLDGLNPGKHHYGMITASLFPITPRCGRSAVMDAQQVTDANQRPVKFAISGEGPFWLDGSAPQTRSDAIVRCTCGNSFNI